MLRVALLPSAKPQFAANVPGRRLDAGRESMHSAGGTPTAILPLQLRRRHGKTAMGTRPLLVMAVLALAPAGVSAQLATEVRALLTGKAAMGDWRSDAPGVRRRIAPSALPAPHAPPRAPNGPGTRPLPP